MIQRRPAPEAQYRKGTDVIDGVVCTGTTANGGDDVQFIATVRGKLAAYEG